MAWSSRSGYLSDDESISREVVAADSEADETVDEEGGGDDAPELVVRVPEEE